MRVVSKQCHVIVKNSTRSQISGNCFYKTSALCNIPVIRTLHCSYFSRLKTMTHCHLETAHALTSLTTHGHECVTFLSVEKKLSLPFYMLSPR